MRAAIVTKRFIVCPICETNQFDVEHLFGPTPRTFGPWSCGKANHWTRVPACRAVISGCANPDGTVDISFTLNEKPNGIALLKLRDLYLVRLEPYGRVAGNRADFFYHSHQCPTNLLNGGIMEVFAPSGESDVHGMLRFVANIDDTEEARSTIDGGNLSDVFKLFDTDGEPAKTEWPEEDGGMLPFVAEWRRDGEKLS